jgi:hypothetical protein
LISAISHPQVIIYIHIDKKSDLAGSAFPDHVRIVKNSVEVTWKLFSQVKAILNSLAEIVHNETKFDYLTLISGQDYPIVSMETILGSLAEQAGTEFIHHVPLDQTGWNQARIRFERFYFQSYPGPLIRLGGRLVTYICDKVRYKRRFYKGLRPWGGSAWWTLSRPCILYILNFLEKNKSLTGYMMKTIHADEIIFQTIIMNSPFAENAVSKNLRYMEWVKGNPNPNILTRSDFLKIVASPDHFARKFDSEIDEEIMDMLENQRNRSL